MVLSQRRQKQTRRRLLASLATGIKCTMAPTVLREGRFGFSSSPAKSRIRNTVSHPEGEAKFWLAPTVPDCDLHRPKPAATPRSLGRSSKKLTSGRSGCLAPSFWDHKVTHVSWHGFGCSWPMKSCSCLSRQFPWFRQATIDKLSASRLLLPIISIGRTWIYRSRRRFAINAFPLVARTWDNVSGPCRHGAAAATPEASALKTTRRDIAGCRSAVSGFLTP